MKKITGIKWFVFSFFCASLDPPTKGVTATFPVAAEDVELPTSSLAINNRCSCIAVSLAFKSFVQSGLLINRVESICTFEILKTLKSDINTSPVNISQRGFKDYEPVI